MSKRNFDKIINKAYFDLNSPASYAGIQKVFKETKKKIPNLKYKEAKEFMEGQSTYTLYRPTRKRFKRLATVPSGLNSDWQCDLAIFDSISKYNDGYKYLLVCIDVLSRKIYVAPTKSKSSRHMKEAFEKVFKKSKIKPLQLYSDRGLEFQAREMKKFYEDNDIIKYVVYSPDVHAGIVERANRTIKERLYRYFHKNMTQRWIDVIDNIIDNINNSINRTIGMNPNDVDSNNSKILYENLYGNAFNVHKPKYKTGDIVRISKEKGAFAKGYHPGYTSELFRIKVAKNSNPPHYKLQDMEGEDILGVFYEPELSYVRINAGDQKI